VKVMRTWIVLNRNGNPPTYLSDCFFESKESALGMAKTWMAMAGRKSPNSTLSVHRATVTVGEHRGE
jgi:hypothetical protein